MLYAKLPDGATESAEHTTTEPDVFRTADSLLAEGFLPLVYTDPPDVPAGRGYYWNARYRRIEDERIEQFWVEEAAPPAPPRSLSKVKLMRALKARSLWLPVKAFISASEDYADEWELSTTLDEDNELIVSAVAALKAQLGLTDEQVEEILAASVAD